MSQKLTAVTIQDEKNICRSMESILTVESSKTITASTGTEGLSVIASQCPDIILLDLGLPDMDEWRLSAMSGDLPPRPLSSSPPAPRRMRR